VKPRILFVGDDHQSESALSEQFRHGAWAWEVLRADTADAAWDELLERPADVVLSALPLENEQGLRLLKRIRGHERTAATQVLVLATSAESPRKRQALELGAADLLILPIQLDELMARIRNLLSLKSYQDDLRAVNELLEHRVRRRTRELAFSRAEIVWRLAKAAEHHDTATGSHVVRVGCYSRTLANVMGLEGDFSNTLFLAAPLHDIGKLGVPDTILLKSGRLTDQERAVMQQHCVIGHNILHGEVQRTAMFEVWDKTVGACLDDFDNPVLEMGATIALAHHERWDGSGYPRQLRGESIPLPARIVTVADVFDALTTARPYKAAMREKEARSIMRDMAGLHFDPRVFAAFESGFEEICHIRSLLPDENTNSRSVELHWEELAHCR
jgi:response regulator RpfG family c-di-GMP phosphodiesterase